ncbi:MAG TPA: divalent-cation tolerance protein CutA [Candidatus Omnitrophota bacterium]|nr:divalent-cation tolerance protein CutA [Candidatus Omnitrophota bacterium]
MYIVVFVMAKNREEADKIAGHLVENKLVACANIIEGVRSVFWWNGKIDAADETLLILKSKRNSFKKIIKAVTALHSYEVPEIIALPIVAGNKSYLKWIGESCCA